MKEPELEEWPLGRGDSEAFTLDFEDLPDDVSDVQVRVAGSGWESAQKVNGVWQILLRGPDAAPGGLLVSKNGNLEVMVHYPPQHLSRLAAFIELR